MRREHFNAFFDQLTGIGHIGRALLRHGFEAVALNNLLQAFHDHKQSPAYAKMLASQKAADDHQRSLRHEALACRKRLRSALGIDEDLKSGRKQLSDLWPAEMLLINELNSTKLHADKNLANAAYDHGRGMGDDDQTIEQTITTSAIWNETFSKP